MCHAPQRRVNAVRPHVASASERFQCYFTGRRVAKCLFISPNTVQQHLKAIFLKIDVGSRRALVSEIYDRCYFPRTKPGGGTGEVDATGWFAGDVPEVCGPG